MAKYLVRVYLERKKSKNFTVYSDSSLGSIAETIQRALKNEIASDSRGSA